MTGSLTIASAHGPTRSAAQEPQNILSPGAIKYPQLMGLQHPQPRYLTKSSAHVVFKTHSLSICVHTKPTASQ